MILYFFDIEKIIRIKFTMIKLIIRLIIGKSTFTTTGLHLPAGMSAQTVVLPVFRHWTLTGEVKGGASGQCPLSKHCNPSKPHKSYTLLILK